MSPNKRSAVRKYTGHNFRQKDDTTTPVQMGDTTPSHMLRFSSGLNVQQWAVQHKKQRLASGTHSNMASQDLYKIKPSRKPSHVQLNKIQSFPAQVCTSFCIGRVQLSYNTTQNSSYMIREV